MPVCLVCKRRAAAYTTCYDCIAAKARAYADMSDARIAEELRMCAQTPGQIDRNLLIAAANRLERNE